VSGNGKLTMRISLLGSLDVLVSLKGGGVREGKGNVLEVSGRFHGGEGS